MNWGKAKTILIIFLLFTTLLLSAMLHTSNSKRNTISDDTVNNAIKILSQRNITIEPSLIPKSLESAPIYTVENALIDQKAFVKAALGEKFTFDNNLYTSEKGTLAFWGDRFSVTYPNGLETDSALKSPAEKARAYLLTLGLDLYKTDVLVENDATGVFTVSFSSKLDKLPFFDRSIKCTLRGERLIGAEGSWFYNEEFSPSQASLDSVPSLLIKYLNENTAFSNIEITKLTLGYAINENSIYHKKATVLPVYQLETADNKVFYIDARQK